MMRAVLSEMWPAWLRGCVGGSVRRAEWWISDQLWWINIARGSRVCSVFTDGVLFRFQGSLWYTQKTRKVLTAEPAVARQGAHRGLGHLDRHLFAGLPLVLHQHHPEDAALALPGHAGGTAEDEPVVVALIIRVEHPRWMRGASSVRGRAGSNSQLRPQARRVQVRLGEAVSWKWAGDCSWDRESMLAMDGTCSTCSRAAAQGQQPAPHTAAVSFTPTAHGPLSHKRRGRSHHPRACCRRRIAPRQLLLPPLWRPMEAFWSEPLPRGARARAGRRSCACVRRLHGGRAMMLLPLLLSEAVRDGPFAQSKECQEHCGREAWTRMGCVGVVL